MRLLVLECLVLLLFNGAFVGDCFNHRFQVHHLPVYEALEYLIWGLHWFGQFFELGL